MNHTEAEYRQILQVAFPDALLQAVLMAVIDGYKATPSACKKAMDIPDRHDAFGMIRRGKINEQLRGVCDRHFIEFKDEPNKNGSAFFLSVFSQQVRLVAHLSGGRRRMVRPAKIRKLWARHNLDGRNLTMFGASSEQVPPETKYVAYLLHGPRGRRRDQPGFVEIVIPDRDYRDFIIQLDLFGKFPQIANNMVKGQDVERKQPKPRRRKDTGTQTA